MPHSFNKIWIHAIWATKERKPLIDPKWEKNLHQYMCEQFIALGCPVRIINGMADHVHCLFLLDPQKSIADIVKQIKGSSSHCINRSDWLDEKFAWQIGYAAFSVSQSTVDAVFYYIKNQKQHHGAKSFVKEYETFLQLYGFEEKI